MRRINYIAGCFLYLILQQATPCTHEMQGKEGNTSVVLCGREATLV